MDAAVRKSWQTGLRPVLAAPPFAPALTTAAARVEADIGQGDDTGQFGKGVSGMGNRVRGDEVFLKTWFDRGFDLVDVVNSLFDLRACAKIAQSDPRAGAGGIPGGGDL